MAESDPESSTNTDDVNELKSEILRLRDEVAGLHAEADLARARLAEGEIVLEGLPLARENLRLRDDLAQARTERHLFETLFLRISAERERDHERLVNEFIGSRTWKIGAAVMNPLKAVKRGSGAPQ